MRPDRETWDPPEAYSDRSPPPGFLESLKALDRNLTVAWHIENAVWMLAEIRDVPVVEFSDILGPKGEPIEKSRTYRRVAIEFGEEQHLGPHVIDRIRRYSPKFHGNPEQDSYDAAMAAQEAAYRAHKDAQADRTEKMAPARAMMAGDFGVPLTTVEEDMALAKKAEAELRAERDSFFRNVMTPSGKMETTTKVA